MHSVRKLALWAVAAIAWPAFAADNTGLVPLEQFTRFSEYSVIKISPDGQYLAVAGGKNGASLLEFFSIGEGKITAAVKFDGDFQVAEFSWISASKVIYMLAQRQPGQVQPVPTGELVSIDRDARNQNLIYGYRAGENSLGTHRNVRQASYATPEFITSLKKDDRRILIAEHPWREFSEGLWREDADAHPNLVRLDTISGDKQRAGSVPLSEASVLIDHMQRVRVATGKDRQQQNAAVWKPDPEGEWVPLSLAEFRSESVRPRLFGKDDRSLYFIGTRKDENFSALYRMELQSGRVDKVAGLEGLDVDDVVLDFANENVTGIVGYGDRPVYSWLDEGDRVARVYKALGRALPGQSVRITSTSEDGHFAVVEASSDVNPGDYYLFDTQTLKASYLQSKLGWIDPARMHSKEPFTIKARDGTTLHGYLTRPGGPGPHPMVVLPHGGPHFVRDYWEFDYEVQLLASRGYAVLQVNFRGSDGYGSVFADSGYREWGGRMQDDVTDATRWAIDQKIARADGVCIFGSSYGGYAALMGVVREPGLYRCAIGYAGVYDLELMLTSADIPDSRMGRAYLQATLGDDHAQLRARSPVANAQSIQVPVLLIHGTEDWRADFKQATRMKAALEANRKKFEWMKLRGEGHGAYNEQTRLEVYQRVLEFLDANIGATQASH